ncbi:hypothetical protein LJR296_006546 [Cupriavidus necator]|uniref:hypothetical protein n=1 Tax=Cupriavidus necator TaxID=106590 RepID=UPI003ECD1C75
MKHIFLHPVFARHLREPSHEHSADKVRDGHRPRSPHALDAVVEVVEAKRPGIGRIRMRLDTPPKSPFLFCRRTTHRFRLAANEELESIIESTGAEQPCEGILCAS